MNTLKQKFRTSEAEASTGTMKHPKIKSEIVNNNFSQDFLIIFIYYTQIFVNLISDYLETFKKSKTGSVILRCTQPIHFIMIVLIGTMSCVLFQTPRKEEKYKSPFMHMIYFGSVSAHFGTQLWMTFISGLTLYFNLPRCIFRNVQQILFPIYFLINSSLSFVSLLIFLQHNNLKVTVPSVLLQVGVLTTCCLIEVVITFYFTPPLLQLMNKISILEEISGVGMEIGQYNPGVLAFNDEYVILYGRFRRIHICIAMCNVITIICSTIHIIYLSKKIMHIQI